MNRVFLFNPENDIALAAGRQNFTPPKAAVQMALSGATLPWWLGDSDDYLLLSDGDMRREWFAEVVERFGGGPQPVVSLNGLEVAELSPWGRSAYTARLFRKAGAPEPLVRRDMERADFYRSLSHRRTAMRVLHGLGFDSVTEAACLDDVRRFASRFPDFYVKAPWSSSGRGVFRGRDISEAQVAGIIRRQGSVMLERGYDGVQDFAALYYARGGDVEFHGYSMFFTGGAAYGGNLLLTDEEIARRIGEMAGAARLAEVRCEVGRLLAETAAAPGYEGPLGVDMLVYRSGDGFDIAPCIEVNLRYTMGFVAHGAVERGVRGRMTVTSGGDIPAGAFALSAPAGGFRFIAEVR